MKWNSYLILKIFYCACGNNKLKWQPIQREGTLAYCKKCKKWLYIHNIKFRRFTIDLDVTYEKAWLEEQWFFFLDYAFRSGKIASIKIDYGYLKAILDAKPWEKGARQKR